nr:MAG TPA: hypothetical protein [Caudoviricetes sp.]
MGSKSGALVTVSGAAITWLRGRENVKIGCSWRVSSLL